MTSAKEEIDRLTKIDAFQKNINIEPMELMEVVIKNPYFQEGDTAIVNYKVKDYKNNLTLILKDKKWYVANSNNLKGIVILKYESSDFIKELGANPNIFWEKYKGMSFLIENIMYYGSYGNFDVGIPYSEKENLIFIKKWKKPSINLFERFLYKNKEFNYYDFEKYPFISTRNLLDEYGDGGYLVFFDLNGLSAEIISKLTPVKKELLKTTVNEYGVKCVENFDYSFTNIISIIGTLDGWEKYLSDHRIILNDCILVNIK